MYKIILFYLFNNLPAALIIFEIRFNCSTVEQMNVLPKNKVLRLLFTCIDTEFGFRRFSAKTGMQFSQNGSSVNEPGDNASLKSVKYFGHTIDLADARHINT